MIVFKTLNYTSSKYADPDSNGNIIQVDSDLNSIFQCLKGSVRFGEGNTGKNGENISGQWLTITTNAVPDTEDTFTHTLGSIPIGYIITGQNKAGSLYQLSGTGTAWTRSTISLKCSIASVQFKLFLLM